MRNVVTLLAVFGLLIACTPAPAALGSPSPIGLARASAGARVAATSTPESTITATPTATESATATATATVAPTAAPAAQTATPTQAATPAPATPVPTVVPTVVPTAVPTVAPTVVPTATPVPVIPRPAVPATGLIISGRVTNASTGRGIGNACITVGPPIRCFKYTSTGPTAADVGYYVVNLTELVFPSGSSIDMYFLYQAGGCKQAYSGIFVITKPVVKNAALTGCKS